MDNYDTVTEALTGLKLRGYTLDFNISFDKIICPNNNFILHPDEFEITKVYRFEGPSDPGDEEVIYAVESTDGALKGVITGAYGPYADSISTDIIKKLTMHPRP